MSKPIETRVGASERNDEADRELGSLRHEPPQEIQPDSPHDALPADARASTSEQKDRVGPLDLNHASEAQIAEIDLIGKKLAHAIVGKRSERGGFRSWEELQDIPGLDAKRIAELQRAARLGEAHA